jgi:hypothetical protein
MREIHEENAHPAARDHARRAVPALILGAALAGCGGGPGGSSDFLESLVRLLSARFVPASISMPRGSTRAVDLEVSCDRAGLDTPFGRLGIRVKLDPESRLPLGLSGTLVNVGPLDRDGFALIPCTSATTDPNLRVAHVAVQVQAAANAPVTPATLVAFVEVEPLTPGQPSKDSTRADLAITVTGGEGTGPTS